MWHYYYLTTFESKACMKPGGDSSGCAHVDTRFERPSKSPEVD